MSTPVVIGHGHLRFDFPNGEYVEYRGSLQPKVLRNIADDIEARARELNTLPARPRAEPTHLQPGDGQIGQ